MTEYCEACNDTGLFDEVDTGKVFRGRNRPTEHEHITQRCDQCQKYENDEVAAAVWYGKFRIIHAEGAGAEVCVDKRTSIFPMALQDKKNHGRRRHLTAYDYLGELEGDPNLLP